MGSYFNIQHINADNVPLPLTNFVQLSVLYSNAVLVAIAPYVSDFSHKLGLITNEAVTSRQVTKFVSLPLQGQVGGTLWLTNGYVFSFFDGVVAGYQDEPRSWQAVEGETRIPEFNGLLCMNKTEAIAFARSSIKKLGYEESDFYADGDPSVGMPFAYGTNFIPYYTIEWADPQGPPDPHADGYCFSAHFEIDGQHRRLTEVHFATRTIRRPQPAIALASIEPAQKQDEHLKLNDDPKLAFKMLNDISEYASKLNGKNVSIFTTNDVQSYDAGGYPDLIEVSLTDGAHYVMTRGYVSYYRGPHCFFGGYLDQRVKDYWGKWEIGDLQAIELARAALRRLNYSDEIVHYKEAPVVKRPFKVGDHEIPRYQILWSHEDRVNGELQSYSRSAVEVDGVDGTIKSVCVESPLCCSLGWPEL